MNLLEKINNRSATIGVIGLGYVGLPLAIQFVKSGFKTIGFDVDKAKVSDLKEGKTYIRHIPIEQVRILRTVTGSCPRRIMCTKDTDCVIICVPTPLGQYREPDLPMYLIQQERSQSTFIRTSSSFLSPRPTRVPQTGRCARSWRRQAWLPARTSILPFHLSAKTLTIRIFQPQRYQR